MGETAWGSNETRAQGDETRIAAALEKRRGIEDAASSAQLESAFVGKYFKCRRCQKGGWKSRVPLIAESQLQGDEVRPEGRYFSVSYVTLTLRVSCRVHSSTDCVRSQFFCIVGPLYREAALVTVICHIL